ncbi:bifunctional folylpolyglutamate synthase/dihydrofolate synthase [Pseudohalioglobus sediminis]|uniref:Dihydrofolate synthase/folylpolyglutamate synthase n=1 Tax=Pseudohalioglobus sediminis TaxID=2606449 RepID=A0A5B0X5V8_9GAMM|nr:folylpolyglutamate synthase/dihydrofolate synthase family protein [Pseudohalioglobus sediminis]KAA1193887.1 bifunctional folylpolyglutamate synthase/dihydrofolate synthase [Pseudohalioglobus sediminis]
MSKRTLDEWLRYLESLHPNAMDLGLERVTQVAHSLSLLPLTVPAVTVAGTNGKGSTVAVLESLLRECGHRVGTFTSPHFLRFNERIRIDGEDAADDDIVAAFTAIEQARGGVSLTYFEFANLAALWLFREQGVDRVVLEVGLGGRLDSTNMVDADVAVITSIDLDHQEWLGDTRAAIAREKAGIMRPGKPVVIADPEPPAELLECAQQVAAAPVMQLGHEFGYGEPGASWQGYLTGADAGRRELPSLATEALWPSNICAALQAACLLGETFSDEQVRRALAGAHSTGRCQHLDIAGRHYLLDVAHNPAAIDKLLEKIDATPCNGKVIALFSAMKDKPVEAMLSRFGARFQAWFLGEQPANPRAMAATDIADILHAQGQQRVSVSKNLRQALRRAQAVMQSGDLLVVFGSFFTVAAVLPQLERDQGKTGLHE